MITPAYSPTATERVLPRMALDFTTGVLDSRVTIARALNTATRVNASGLVEIVNANLPRFDYNPSTLAPRGLLIEELRANLFVWSEEFDNASWTKNNATISPNAIIAPDGTTTADKLVETVATGQHYVRTSAASTNIAYTFSVYLKAGERTRAVIAMTDLSTGDASVGINLLTGATFASSLGVGSWTNISSAVVAMPNGWYRVSITGTRGGGGTSTAGSIYTDNGSTISYTGDGTSGIFVWGAQLEAGAFATSYIPTTTTSLTRNADVVSMTGTNFSSWHNASEGTFSATFQTIVTGLVPAATFIVGFDNNASKRVMYIGTGADQVASFDGTSVLSAGVDSTGSVITCLSAYSAAGRSIAATGLNPATGTIAAGYSTATSLNIGNSGGVTLLNGRISKLLFWPQRLTARELSAFSK